MYFALRRRAALQPGETVLVPGAAGGVGTAVRTPAVEGRLLVIGFAAGASHGEGTSPPETDLRVLPVHLVDRDGEHRPVCYERLFAIQGSGHSRRVHSSRLVDPEDA